MQPRTSAQDAISRGTFSAIVIGDALDNRKAAIKLFQRGHLRDPVIQRQCGERPAGLAALLHVFAEAVRPANTEDDLRFSRFELAREGFCEFFRRREGLPGLIKENQKVAIIQLFKQQFALASAFVDVRPSFAPLVVRHRAALWRAVLAAMAVWFVWTVTDLPPLQEPGSEGGSHSVIAAMAAGGTVLYAVAAGLMGAACSLFIGCRLPSSKSGQTSAADPGG